MTQADLVQLLHDNLVLFKECEDNATVPVLQNSLNVFSRGTHKILVQHFLPAELVYPDVHPIFGEEECPAKRKPILNKLELQKSSLKTTDAFAVEESVAEKRKSHFKNEFKKTALPYRFAMSSCFELFKEGLLASCDVQPTEEQLIELIRRRRESSFKRLFEFMEMVRGIGDEDLDSDAVHTVIGKMSLFLEPYKSGFFSFANECICILQKPVFHGTTQLRLELTGECRDVKKTCDVLLHHLAYYIRI